MIPKIIHCCWFGKGEMPMLAKKCMNSWSKYCPDYEVKLWNENSFDINSCVYVREAYDNRKYAFVTDYVRLWALYQYGGVYMDTDVEVKKSLDSFLYHEAFSGFESDKSIPTGIMAGVKGFKLFSELLSYYEGRHFVREDGTLDMKTNTSIITELLQSHGFTPNGQFQIVDGFALYPRDYFCPFDYTTGVMHKSVNTATVHWFNMSWIPMKYRIRSKLTRIIHRWFGVNALKMFKKKQ